MKRPPNPITEEPDKTEYYLASKSALSLVACSLVMVIFRQPLKDVFDDLLVSTVLRKVPSSTATDIAWLLSILVLVMPLYRACKRRMVVGYNLILTGAILFAGYLWCRVQNIYDYTEMQLFPAFAYADILILPILGVWTIKITELLLPFKPTNNANFIPFLTDQPSKTDFLGRSEPARKIAQRIQANAHAYVNGERNYADTLAIGICGPWGSGKTTFLNLIKNELPKGGFLEINFNPWRSTGTDKIVEDFFELLISELKKYDFSLSKNLHSYAKSLTTIDENIGTKIVQTVSDFFETTDMNALYDSIENALKNGNRQIVVFIDDIDRLDPPEIMQVLKIIRNTANFSNLIYLVAYDNAYIHEAIKFINIHNPKSFLEKIFQIEFQLPIYDPAITHTFLKEQLKEKLPQLSLDIIETTLGAQNEGFMLTDHIILTQRDAIRLINSLVLEFELISFEVCFYDFYLLQLLKLKFNTIYRHIAEHRDQIFLTNDPSINYIRLRYIDENKKAHEELLTIDNANKFPNFGKEKSIREESYLHNYLLKLKSSGQLSDENMLIVEKLAAELLDSNRIFNKKHPNESSKVFARKRNLFKYFALDLHSSDISHEELQKSRQQPFEIYEQRINSWIAEGKTRTLFDSLCSLEEFTQKDEFENHLKALFKVGRNLAGDRTFDNVDYNRVWAIVILPKTKTGNAFYINDEAYAEFLTGLFNMNTENLNFPANLLDVALLQPDPYPFPFTTIEHMLIDILKKCLERPNPFDHTFWNIYHNCNKNSGRYLTDANPEAKTLSAASFKTKATNRELKYFVQQSHPHDYYMLHMFVVELFMDNKANLGAWLNNTLQLDRSSDDYLEFVRFFEKTKLANWGPVEFKFEYLEMNA
jgi:hypothetical protein